MKSVMGEADVLNAYERMMCELKQVAEPMIYLLLAINEAILLKRLGARAEVVTSITDAPGVFEVGIPFFVEVPDQPI